MRLEISDRRTGKIDDSTTGVRRKIAGEIDVVREVGTHGENTNLGKIFTKDRRAPRQRVVGDFDGNVGGGSAKRPEEQLRFRSGAAAGFDYDGVGSDCGCHLVARRFHDRHFGASEIVLVELAYLFKKKRAVVVVEILGMERLLGLGETVDDVVEKRLVDVVAFHVRR